MFKRLFNDKGETFVLAIMLLFVTTSFITFCCFSYKSQISTYNSLEFANVHATVNLLKEIGSKQ